MNTFTNSKTPSFSTGITALDYYLHALSNYTNFNGRARRSEYWYFVLVYFIGSFGVGFIDGLLFNSGLLSMIYLLATLVPYIAVCVRRMHDVGKSGWYALIPIYNFILAIQEGTPGMNEYGKNPKEA
ncbi:DUF805 domain-containing protein [Tellurirhabdus rosea]|uniref:DUF805 domain-containing protein n=1 Tax=Tellurirhabdus rosea TaxID=2674997 RepID=UPI002251B39E|nr:DUF805 domain-containing protein [Tellurirhabdus rosea]